MQLELASPILGTLAHSVYSSPLPVPERRSRYLAVTLSPRIHCQEVENNLKLWVVGMQLAFRYVHVRHGDVTHMAKAKITVLRSFTPSAFELRARVRLSL